FWQMEAFREVCSYSFCLPHCRVTRYFKISSELSELHVRESSCRGNGHRTVAADSCRCVMPSDYYRRDHECKFIDEPRVTKTTCDLSSSFDQNRLYLSFIKVTQDPVKVTRVDSRDVNAPLEHGLDLF